MSHWVILLVLAFMVALAGCTGSSGAPTTTAAAPTTSEPATTTTDPGFDPACTVAVEGDEPRTWVGPDEEGAFASDYWQSVEELRDQYEFLSIQDDPPFDEVLAAGEPVFTFFLMSCVGRQGDAVAIFVSDQTRRDDFPMAPGEHPITGGFFGAGHLPAGEFSASYLPATGTVWGEEGRGSLTISRWDLSRVEGSFSFTAEDRFADPPRVVRVTGTFDFACTQSVVCE